MKKKNNQLKTYNYIYPSQPIEIGETYLFGQLWDGSGDGEELLESGCVYVLGTPDPIFNGDVINFEITEVKENLMDTLVKVVSIGQKGENQNENERRINQCYL